MLAELKIRNFALIRELELHPGEGFTVITGETGAGKSILLGALELILGARADSGVLLNAEEKCVVEAVFELGEYRLNDFFEKNGLDYDDRTIVRREIAPGGKSRGFINDTPVTLALMKELGESLVDIHAQNTTVFLGAPQSQLEVLDQMAGNSALLADYRKTYQHWQKLKITLENLKAEQSEWIRQEDFNRFQLEELQTFKPVEGEETELEKEIHLLENAGQLGTVCGAAANMLRESESSAADILARIRTQLKPYQGVHETIDRVIGTLDSIIPEVKEMAVDLLDLSEKVEADPARLEMLSQRFDQLQHLLRKHRFDTSAQLLALLSELENRVTEAGNADAEIAETEAAMNAALDQLKKKAQMLSARRKEAAGVFESGLPELLQQLEMPTASVRIETETISDAEPGPSGTDQIRFLFSANKGQALQPLGKVASGGELSRLIFCIKVMLAGKVHLPTLIFDEIDAGISGEAATRMSKMMKLLARQHQLIVVTHLPQIAAAAGNHWYVFKEDKQGRTQSSIKTLQKSERIVEIARMISGNEPMKSALAHAEKLLAN